MKCLDRRDAITFVEVGQSTDGDCPIKRAELQAKLSPLSSEGRPHRLAFGGAIGIVGGLVICPFLSGPKSILFWTTEIGNAIEEAPAGGDYRQAA